MAARPLVRHTAVAWRRAVAEVAAGVELEHRAPAQDRRFANGLDQAAFARAPTCANAPAGIRRAAARLGRVYRAARVAAVDLLKRRPAGGGAKAPAAHLGDHDAVATTLHHRLAPGPAARARARTAGSASANEGASNGNGHVDDLGATSAP